MADNKQIVDYILNVQVGTAKRDLNQLASSADKSADKVDELGDESKKSAKDVKKLGKASKKSGAGMVAAFAKAANIVTGLQSAFSLAGDAYRIFDAALRSGFDATRDTVDNINQLNDAAARSGLSAGGVQAVIQAFEGAGLSAQSAEAFVSRLPRQLSDLADSSTSAAQAYQLLGGNIRDAQGNVKSADTLLKELTHNFQNMTDGGQRALVAFEVFGRSAGSFLQAFGATAEFDKFLAFSDAFGVNVEKGGKEAAVFQEALSALSIQAKGLAQSLVVSSGGMEGFNIGMRAVIVGMAQLKGFLDAGSAGIQLFAKQLLKVAEVVINDIFIRSLNLLTSNIAGTIVSINNLLKAFTKKDFLGDAAEKAGMSALAFYDLDEAMAAGVASGKKAALLFDDIVEGLDLSNKETEEMKKQLEKLFEQLGRTGEGAKAAGNAAKEMADMVADAQSIIADSNSDLLSEQDKIEQKYSDLIDTIDDYKKAGLDAALANRAAAAAERKALREVEQVKADLTKKARSITAAANLDLLSDIDKIEKGYGDLLTQLMDLKNQGVDPATIKTAELAIEAKFLRDIKEANDLLSKGAQEAAIKFATTAASKFEAFLSAPLSSLFEKLGTKVGAEIGAAAARARGESGDAISLAGGTGGSIGAVVAGAVLSAGSFLARMGRKTESEIRAEFESTARAIALGLEVLPAILFDILPDAIRIGVDELGKVIAELPANIAINIANLIGDWLTPRTKEERQQDRAEKRANRQAGRGPVQQAFQEAFSSLFNAPQMANGGMFIPQAANGLRFTGSNRGLAMLHEGETVIPRSGRTSQATERNLAGMGGGITVNINAAVVEGNAIDYIVREMEQRFRTFGQGTSPLFAG